MGPRILEPDREPRCSGIVVDAEKGQIATIDHALFGATQVAVTLPDGRERVTSQIRRDPRSDLALLIIDAQGLNLAQVQWGDTGSLQPGDWVVAIGLPLGSAPTLSAGIMSARRRSRGGGLSEELIETDAVIHAINTGGPLVNLRGEVVGINRLGGGRRDGLDGMGFATPADRARRILGDLIQYGQVRRAYLGVQVDTAEPAVADRVRQPGVVVVSRVQPASAAAIAGLSPGDVILRVGKTTVDGVTTLQDSIEFAPIGEDLPILIDRQGARLELQVKPQALPVPLGPVGSTRPADSLLETRRDLERNRPRSREPRVPRRVPPDRRDVLPEPAPSRTPPPRDDEPAVPSVDHSNLRLEPLPR
jgi:S1-C subfamily serine protease